MAQTQSLEEHLTAVRDELKAAKQKNDADAKTRINAALDHAQIARAELKTRFAKSDAQAKQNADETLKHLDELAQNGQKAMNEAGEALRARVDTMVANAKSAVDSGKRVK